MTLRWKAARTSAALSILFLVVYGLSNWFTSRRADVGSWYFAWERQIPFIPVMILPYMSIDLFFVAAPFLARSERELRTLAWRVAAAILIAGGCFLLFPLRFAFARPPVEGVLGVIFNNFRSLDLPFNQLPSLHIALWAIFLDFYARHTRGVLRGLVVVWLILIALSPVFTYQHHVVDIVGGLVLGVICYHFFQVQPLREPFLPNRRMGLLYGCAGVSVLALAWAWPPWTYVFLWPAVSLALVTCGYFFLGPGIYRKEQGKIAWSAWVLLWPVLMGQRLSLWYYAHCCRPYDHLTDRLWIGRCLSDLQARQARDEGVIAVIDLTSEFSETRAFRELAYLQLSILDLTAPTPNQMDEAVAFIQRHLPQGIVYLHCKIGYSRTAAIAGAYLLATHQTDSPEQAIAAMRRVRPSMIVRPEALAALTAYISKGAQGSGISGNGVKVPASAADGLKAVPSK